jgi:hypothetical protein
MGLAGGRSACAFSEIVPLSSACCSRRITFTLKPFLAKEGHSVEDVEKMYAAWVKSCLVQVTLWSYPYINSGDF